MKRVKKTIEIELRTMKNMAENLSQRFRCYCSVDLSVKNYFHSSEVEFRLYREETNLTSLIFLEFQTWSELQKAYFELIKQPPL